MVVLSFKVAVNESNEEFNSMAYTEIYLNPLKLLASILFASYFNKKWFVLPEWAYGR